MSELIYTAKANKAWDQYTIETQGITSIELVEQAARACVNEITKLVPAGRRVIVFAGPGNNGADGLAIARLLSDRQYRVAVHQPDYEKYSSDNLTNQQLLPKSVDVIDLPDSFEMRQYACVIDAILGNGINRPLSGQLKDVIALINASEPMVISIDLPSGMPGDGHFDYSWSMIQAHYTLALQQYKWNMLLPESGSITGEVKIIPIGLSPRFHHLDAYGRLLRPWQLNGLFRTRSRFDHKGSFGHALLIAGSKGMYGAAVLSALSCSRMGAGLTSLAAPEELIAPLAAQHPEIMAFSFGSKFWLDPIADLSYKAIGIGPGLGTALETWYQFRQILLQYKGPLVLDADALNLISKHNGALDLIPEGSIITPHMKEFDNLFGKQEHWWARIKTLRHQAETRKIIIILKNAYTFIAGPAQLLHINTTGNPGLAKGGSGDVLTGMITGLLAQGLLPFDAARLAVYLHGTAAELSTEEIDLSGLMATDLIAKIPSAVKLMQVQAQIHQPG
jgi:hydroxyethylthiazole kinase-like uncharacterized protein yjeF